MAFIACTEEDVRFNDLAKIVPSKNTIIADGADTATFIIEFNQDSNIELIDANVRVVNGSFTDSDSNEKMIEPIKDPDGVIRANIGVVSSTIVDSLKIIVNVNEFKTSSSIPNVTSEPSTMSLSASGFSVANSFESEITITGTVLNSQGKKASNGFQVLIEDTFADGSAVNGLFRNESLRTSNGQISFIYSPGPVIPEQFINLKATVLDPTSGVTTIMNSIQIYVTTND